jgi:sodium/pantothenate symporter
LKDVKKIVPITASLTAVIVHFSFYYGQIKVPFTVATGENPGVAAAMAILTSLVVGGFIYLSTRRKQSV